jgi:hypothetical protein
MPVVAIDRTKGTRKMFTCSNELAEEITAWRTAQQPSERECCRGHAPVAGSAPLA